MNTVIAEVRCLLLAKIAAAQQSMIAAGLKIPLSKGALAMKREIVAGSVALLFAGIAFAKVAAHPAKEPATREALQKEIEALRPPNHVWRAIPWMTCPLEALKASRTLNKPVIAWVFLGIPTDERC